MGDLVLTEDQVMPVMDAALDAGLEATTSPSIGRASCSCTSRAAGRPRPWRKACARCFDAARAARHTPPLDGFGGPAVPATSSLSPAPLEAVLGATGHARDGMVKFRPSMGT
jgi:hypothetical protein